MKLIKSLFIALISLAALAFIIVYFILRASLPSLDHEFSSPWVSNQTVIERDKIGAVTIKAQSHSDAVFAL